MCAAAASAGGEYAHRTALRRPGLPRVAVSAAPSARPSPIRTPASLAGLQWKYQVIGC